MKSYGSVAAIIVFGTAVLTSDSSAVNFKSSIMRDVSQHGRTLSFSDRVAYQYAIEEVYWRHRIWPKENPGPKPSLDEVVSPAQIEQKVRKCLRDSQALEDYWQQPITAEQLQGEMERMAQHTRQPDVLRELFQALGNEPLIIAECLARPVLVERLIGDLDAKEDVPARSAACPGLGQQAVVATYCDLHKMSMVMASGAAEYSLPEISDPAACTDDAWTPTSTTNAPSARRNHTAVWTGTEMIIWGGFNSSGVLSSGRKYTPSTDTWTATSTDQRSRGTNQSHRGLDWH